MEGQEVCDVALCSGEDFQFSFLCELDFGKSEFWRASDDLIKRSNF